MLATAGSGVIAGSGGLGTGSSNFGEFKKQQDYMHTSPAFGIGRGERSDPIKYMTHWTPSPNTYDTSKGGAQNEAPKFK